MVYLQIEGGSDVEDGEVEEVDSDAEDEIDREDENKVNCGIQCICALPCVWTVEPYLTSRLGSDKGEQWIRGSDIRIQIQRNKMKRKAEFENRKLHFFRAILPDELISNVRFRLEKKVFFLLPKD